MVEHSWIVKDDGALNEGDFHLLMKYLSENEITPQGLFADDILDENLRSLRFLMFAVKNHPSFNKLKRKVRLLASAGGHDPKEIKRNYQNQLVEFHALYCMEHLLGYQFIDFDAKSGKASASGEKDCDLHLKKGAVDVYVEVKDCSGEILGQQALDSPSGCDLSEMVEYTPKIELTEWVNGQLKIAKQKGADILVCHTPLWELDNLAPQAIKKFCERAFHDAIEWHAEGCKWKCSSEVVRLIVFLSQQGCWLVEANMK